MGSNPRGGARAQGPTGHRYLTPSTEGTNARHGRALLTSVAGATDGFERNPMNAAEKSARLAGAKGTVLPSPALHAHAGNHAPAGETSDQVKCRVRLRIGGLEPMSVEGASAGALTSAANLAVPALAAPPRKPTGVVTITGLQRGQQRHS